MSRRELGIVVATFLGQAVAIGATVGSFTLFVRPVATEFDAATSAVSSGAALLVMMLGVSGIGVGLWLDRAPARRVMLTGAAILATGLLVASRAQSLAGLAAACVLTGAGVPMLGPLTTAAVIGKAFDEGRGRALGIANTGVNVGGLVFASVAGPAIEAYGWRTTLVAFAGLAAAIAVPAVLAGIPAALGARPARIAAQGAPERSGVGAPAPAVPPPDELAAAAVWTPRALVRASHFWMVALGMGIGFGTVSGWSVHLAPFLQDRGASTTASATVVGVAQLLAIGGAIAGGTLAERRGPGAVLVAVLGALAACLAAYLALPGVGVAVAVAIAFGATSGGAMPVYSLLLTQRFGATAVGTVLGLSNLCLLPFGIAMPVLGGAIHDRTGDYAWMLVVCAAALAASAALVALSGRAAASAAPVEAAPSAERAV
ncbi:MAG: MFS transporter [Myxococcota bacterium]